MLWMIAMFWMVFEIDGEKCVWIEESGSLMVARLKASLQGVTGFVEGHELDKKTAEKLPKASMRKMLRGTKAQRLLATMGQR
jgi:hypothetical protein